MQDISFFGGCLNQWGAAYRDPKWGSCGEEAGPPDKQAVGAPLTLRLQACFSWQEGRWLSSPTRGR